MFIGTAYSQETVTTVSATEIITKGKVIEGATFKASPVLAHHAILRLYKKEIYVCMVNFEEIICARPQDRGVSTDF